MRGGVELRYQTGWRCPTCGSRIGTYNILLDMTDCGVCKGWISGAEAHAAERQVSEKLDRAVTQAADRIRSGRGDLMGCE